MRRSLLIIFFIIIYLKAFSSSIFFPEFNVYSEMNSSASMFTSYRIDALIDTGLKYGVKVGLGFKNYNVSSILSNTIGLSSLKIYMNPVESFYLGYFLGKNTTLGNADIGYRGFQFHQKTGLEYIGYKDISGTGLEFYADLMDNLLQPHLYFYQPSDTNTNFVNMDTVWYLKMEHYIIELYAGINNVSIYQASLDNTLAYRFGIYVKTIFGKVDFMMGLYSPDTLFGQTPSADSFYLNITEHIIVGFFEQTLTLFTRPSSYNGYSENISNDFDIYIALGAKIDDFGFGAENSLLFSSNYSLSDRLGLYFYFAMNNLMYKTGFYYTLMGDAFSSAYGGFVSITGNI